MMNTTENMHELTDSALEEVTGGAASEKQRWETYEWYTVVRGDNITKIAADYGISWRELARHNPQIKDPQMIRPGDQLKVPGNT